MKSDIGVCPLGVSDDTLAAWYDAMLGNEEAQGIGDHIATCAVCRSRLGGYEQIDQVVRSQRVPQLDADRLWETLHTGMAGAKRVRHGTSRHYHRQLLGSLATAAAVILVVVGFLRLFQSHASVQGRISSPTATTAKLLASPTPLPTLGPSALPVPGIPLSWQNHTVPVQFIQQQSELNLAVWAGNGATAYICNPVTLPGGRGVQQPQIWVTHDLGTTWRQVGHLPALGQVAECSLDIDTANSSRLVALFSGQNTTSLVAFVDYFASDNGGVTWSMIAQGQNSYVGIDQIASAQGKTYAIYSTWSPWPAGVPTPTTVPGQPGRTPMLEETHLAVSTDGLRTWLPVDQPILKLVGAKQQVKQFWMQIGSAGQVSLLADVGLPQSLTPPAQPDTLWISHDGGIHWTQLPAPELEYYLAQATPTGDSWYICGSSYSRSRQNQVTACSMDGGQTWTVRPALRTCASCAEQPIGLGDSYIASDGSLVGLFPYGNAFCCAMYRLPASSSQWQYLGQVAESDNGMMYAPARPSPGSGYIWIYGGSGGGYGLSAIIGGTGNATGVFSTAVYSS